MVGMGNKVIQECVKMATGCVFEHASEFEVNFVAIFCKIVVSHLNSLLPDKHECHIIRQAVVLPDFETFYKFLKGIPILYKF